MDAILFEDDPVLRRLLDALDEAVIVTAVDGRIRLFNAQAESLYGWRTEEVRGTNILDVTVPVAAAPDAQEVMAALVKGESWSGQFTVRRRDGSTFLAEVHDTPLQDSDGRLVGIIGTSRVAPGPGNLELAGFVSHELRNPLTTILGLAAFLEEHADEIDGEIRREVVTQIRDDAERLNSLLDNLLLVSRLEARSFPAEPVLVQRLVPGIVNEFRRRVASREIRVIAADDLPPVLGHNTSLRQIVENLISNADKYSPPGSSIGITLALEDDDVLIAVSDSGPGVPDDDLQHIFQPFYRSGAPALTAGAGLGLTICKRLTEAMGGSIRCRRGFPTGSVFEVRLRLAPPESSSNDASGEG